MAFQENDQVRLTCDIVEYPSEDGPGGVCGRAGDIVIVRHVSAREGFEWPYGVSHEDRTDGNTFSVGPHEIEALPAQGHDKGGEA